LKINCEGEQKKAAGQESEAGKGFRPSIDLSQPESILQALFTGGKKWN
jgi:hypothetical protein